MKQQKKMNYTVTKCFFQYGRDHKGMLALLFFFILSVTGVTLIPPQILKIVVDEILLGSQKKSLLLFAFFYVGSYLLLGLFQFGQELLLVYISQGVCRQLRCTMMQKVHRLTYQNFIRYDSAALESYFNNDVATINTLVTAGAVSMLTDLFKMVGILFSVFLYSWRFGLVVLCFFPFLVWFAMNVRKRMFQAQLKNRYQEQEVNRLVLENVENMPTVKNYDCESWTEEKYDKVLQDHYRAAKQTNFMDGIFSPVMETIKFLVIALLILLAGSRSLDFGISVGAVVALIALLLELFEPVENLGQELQTIQRSLSGLKRLNSFFALEENPPCAGSVPERSENILEFQDVSFSYDGKEEVLSHFNLKVKGVERVVLSGRSGAGKSTVFKLAYGLLQPTSGRVLLNGVDVFTLADEERARYFGLVYQEPFFNGETIYNELTLHRKVPEQKVFEILGQVGLSRIKRLDIPLREQDFSTGELSLLNIARMLLSDCWIVFLDEMNARIDPATAEQIMKIMNEVTRNKMVFSINHYGKRLEHSRIVNLEAYQSDIELTKNRKVVKFIRKVSDSGQKEKSSLYER